MIHSHRWYISSETEPLVPLKHIKKINAFYSPLIKVNCQLISLILISWERPHRHQVKQEVILWFSIGNTQLLLSRKTRNNSLPCVTGQIISSGFIIYISFHKAFVKFNLIGQENPSSFWHQIGNRLRKLETLTLYFFVLRLRNTISACP